MKKYASVDEYMKDVRPEFRDALEHARKVIKQAIPESEEKIYYGMPSFFAPKPVIAYAAFVKHCSIFPMSGSTLRKFEVELKDFEGTKGSVHFTPHHMIPDDVITKIIKARVEETQNQSGIIDQIQERIL